MKIKGPFGDAWKQEMMKLPIPLIAILFNTEKSEVEDKFDYIERIRKLQIEAFAVPTKIYELFHSGWKVFRLDEKTVMATTITENGQALDAIFEDKIEQTRIVCSDTVLRDDLHESIPGSTREGNKLHCKSLFR